MFLKNYTIPFVQLDPMKTILVFSHNHNTFDKKKLLEMAHPDYMKESPKTVDMFIKEPFEKDIKKFFMEDIDEKLAKYEPGEPKMKPDVIEQTKKIEEERGKQMREEMEKQGKMPVLTIQEPGQAPKQLTLNEVVEHFKKSQEEKAMMHMRIMYLEQELENRMKGDIPPSPYFEQPTKIESELQTKLIDANIKIMDLTGEVAALKEEVETLRKKSIGTSDSGNNSKQKEMSASVSMGVSATLKPKSKSDPEVVIQI
jgi:hypothetical protein